MARDTAIKSIVIIVIYFVLLSLIFTGLAAVQTIFGLGSGEVTVDDDSYTTNTCTSPRTLENSVGIPVTFGELTNTNCKYIYDPIECDSISGCEYTSGIFSDYCDGNINTTYYNLTGELTNVCTDLEFSAEECTIVGCTYIDDSGTLDDVLGINPEGFASVTGGFSALKTFFSTLGSAFTLRLDFTTDNSLLNTSLQFFMLLLPLIILIGNVIVLILG